MDDASIDSGNSGITPTRFSGIFAVVGTAAVFTANIAAIITHIESIRTAVSDAFGLSGAQNIQLSVVIIGLVVGEIGFILISIWGYIKYIRDKSEKVHFLYVLASFVIAIILGFVAVKIPKRIDTDYVVKTEAQKLNDQIIQKQVESGNQKGGFVFPVSGASDATDSWTTAQCLFALLADPIASSRNAQQVRDGFLYLEGSRNNEADEGWGYQNLPAYGVTEIIGWVALAEAMSLKPEVVHAIWVSSEIEDRTSKLLRDVKTLVSRQRKNGSWGPLKASADPDHERTYSTIMALWALLEARSVANPSPQVGWMYDENIKRGIQALLDERRTNENEIEGWWPSPNKSHQSGIFPGLTAQALYVLSIADQKFSYLHNNSAFTLTRDKFLDLALSGKTGIQPLREWPIENNAQVPDSQPYLKDTRGFVLESTTFLWYPWTLLSALEIKNDDDASSKERLKAAKLTKALLDRSPLIYDFAEKADVMYTFAENLDAFNSFLSIEEKKAKTAEIDRSA